MKVDSSLYLSNQQPLKQGSSELDKDAFLKILMTQLTNQDPLDPMKDKDFIAQMASFSQLEQMTNLSSSFNKLFEQQQFSNFLQYSNLIGKEVHYTIENKDGFQDGASEVKSVKREGDGIFLSLANGDVVNVSQVYQVDSVQTENEVT